MTEPLAGGTAAAPFSMRAAASLTSAVVRAARQLLTDLERGRRIDAAVLRGATEAAFGASDATGAWNWKIAYDACEVATVLFLRKFGSAIRARSGSPPAMLSMLAKIAGLLPTHTRRSLESEALQQFSTPIPLGLVACTAAGTTPADRVFGALSGYRLPRHLCRARWRRGGVERVGGSPRFYEPFTDSEGNLCSRPVYRDGQPVESREAIARGGPFDRELASLPPVPGALDQVVQRFGTDMVAEVTGRSRRIVRKRDRLVVESRAGSANLAETAAFMDDVKRILMFSDAGGTGRSYHAELSARNRRLRVHYLLEPGWKADTAIQGLGRTNRTNQAQPPLFRPIATDLKAEKRFLSTIARRLDTLGAITRGQR